MAGKLETPRLDPIDEAAPRILERPDLRGVIRRPTPAISSLIAPGFVMEARVPEQNDPDDLPESITIEVPRRVKRALQNEVSRRRDDPEKRRVASMKSVILEALATYGFGDLIRRSDIEVQAGIFMKRQSAQLRRG
jgi:hypothetical protein